jgi:ArsR family transcriptional regulator
MEQFVRVMKALSDPGRVAVLKLLGARELCACEIMRALGLAQPRCRGT